jgi:hypothetical protein
MKFRIIAITIFFAFISLSLQAQVKVRGYYRKDGTYVRPHTRSAPKRRSHTTYYTPNTSKTSKYDTPVSSIASTAKSNYIESKDISGSPALYTYFSRNQKCLVRHCGTQTREKQYGDLGYAVDERSYMPYCSNHTFRCLASDCYSNAVLGPDSFGRFCAAHLQTCFQPGCSRPPIQKAVSGAGGISIGKSFTGHCKDHVPICAYSDCSEQASVANIGYSRFCKHHTNSCHVNFCEKEAVPKRPEDFAYFHKVITYTNLCSDHTPLCSNPACSELASLLPGGYAKFCAKHD